MSSLGSSCCSQTKTISRLWFVSLGNCNLAQAHSCRANLANVSSCCIHSKITWRRLHDCYLTTKRRRVRRVDSWQRILPYRRWEMSSAKTRPSICHLNWANPIIKSSKTIKVSLHFSGGVFRWSHPGPLFQPAAKFLINLDTRVRRGTWKRAEQGWW